MIDTQIHDTDIVVEISYGVAIIEGQVLTNKSLSELKCVSLFIKNCKLSKTVFPEIIGQEIELQECIVEDVVFTADVFKFKATRCDVSRCTFPKIVRNSFQLLNGTFADNTFPEKIGDYTWISKTAGIPHSVHDCGQYDRQIMAHRNGAGKVVISIGCFTGNQTEAVAAVRVKYWPYAPGECERYINKVNEAFELFYKNFPQYDERND